METLAPTQSANPDTKPEFHLLLERDRAYDWRRWRTAGIASAAVHAVLIAALLTMPESATTERAYEQKPVTIVTPLYTPAELTQKAPNKGKVSKELTVAAAEPRPVFKPPSAPAPARKIPASAPLPPRQAPPSEPKLVLAEPPRIQADSPGLQQPDQIAKFTTPPPPVLNQQPKLTLENVAPATSPVQGNPQGKFAAPNNSIDAALRDLAKNPVPGTQSVGDVGVDDNGTGLGLNLPPSAGRPLSSMELRSDPLGVDFRPYMIQVLTAIKRNWLAVYPEAARRGQRGEVVLEFAIAKQGIVTKVIFSSESGAKALDQSAVAALSASNPLPPLPKSFKGERIVLRMTFKYNMQK